MVLLFFPQILLQLPLNLNNADLHRSNLSSLDLTGAMLWNANLQGANLNQTSFAKAYLGNASLQGANLTLTIFINADLTNADLCAVYAKGAQFDGATLTGVNWDFANLTDTTLKAADVVGLSPAGRAPCFTDKNGERCGTAFSERCTTY